MERSRCGILTGEPVWPLIVRVTKVSGVSSGCPKVSLLWIGKRPKDLSLWAVIGQSRFTEKLRVVDGPFSVSFTSAKTALWALLQGKVHSDLSIDIEESMMKLAPPVSPDKS